MGDKMLVTPFTNVRTVWNVMQQQQRQQQHLRPCIPVDHRLWSIQEPAPHSPHCWLHGSSYLLDVSAVGVHRHVHHHLSKALQVCRPVVHPVNAVDPLRPPGVALRTGVTLTWHGDLAGIHVPENVVAAGKREVLRVT